MKNNSNKLKTSMYWIIIYALSMLCFGNEEYHTYDDKSIRGIDYSNGESSDLEIKRKSVILNDKIRQLRESENQELNYSHLSSEEIFQNLIISDGGGNAWDAGIMELSKRSTDVKNLINKTLAKEDPSLFEFTKLPLIARCVDLEYQIAITQEVLFHPAFRKYDQAMLHNNSVLRYLAGSSNQTHVLDKLIAEGRMKQGSEIESHWRNLLAGNQVIIDQFSNKSKKSNKSNHHDANQHDSASTQNNCTSSILDHPLLMVITGTIIIFLLLYILIKSAK